MSRQKLAYIALLVSSIFHLTSTALHAECNEKQAFNKMMAFNQAWMKYQQDYLALPTEQQSNEFQKFSSGAQRMGGLSAKLATKEWNAVCTGYDALAKEFGFDLKQAAKGVLTIEELQKDGGRRGGSCSLADASKRFMQMQEKFLDKKANGEVSLETERAFHKACEPLGLEMTKNPSAVCTKVVTISKEFGL
jgi:hypothetical protein